jgi:hypothetical protein
MASQLDCRAKFTIEMGATMVGLQHNTVALGAGTL